MDWDSFSGQFRRLCAAKDHPFKGEQLEAYYEALKNFPESCVHQALFRAAREVQGWPKSDRLVELSREELRRLEAPSGVCDVCHGEGWVDAPDEVHFNLVYRYVQRCPQCRQSSKAQGAA